MIKLLLVVLAALCQLGLGLKPERSETPQEGCDLPSLPVGIRFQRNPEGDRIYYRCEQGYKVLGHAYAVCDNGEWSHEPPICISSRCHKTYVLTHGRVVLSYSGAMLRFTCDAPYQIVGSDVLVCDGRKWNGTVPTCSDPATSAKSVSTSHRTRYTNTFSKTHSDWLMDSDYSCVKAKNSIHPPIIDHAKATTKWTLIEGSPRLYTLYRCEWGYVARGQSRHLYCQNGEWVGALPKCIIAETTPVPLIPRDASHSWARSHTDWLELADYSCVGTVKDPERVRPAPVYNGRYVWRYDVVRGEPRLYVMAECNHGYRLSKPHVQYMYCQNKAWIGDEEPKCVMGNARSNTRLVTSCSQNNGGCDHICDDRRRGDVVCMCRSGYQLGLNGRSCQDINECLTDNGGCDHICQNNDGAHKCQCNVGHFLAGDGRTCHKLQGNEGPRHGDMIPPMALFHE